MKVVSRHIDPIPLKKQLTGPSGPPRPGESFLGWGAAVILVAFCAVFLTAILSLENEAVSTGKGTGGTEEKPRLSSYYLERARDATGAVNAVTAVLIDYRGFDTLGEATVIFAAVGAVGLLFSKGTVRLNSTGLSPVAQRSIGFLLPVVWSFPVYVILNGHLSPGGGFQGGVSLAVLTILASVAFGHRVPVLRITPERVSRTEALAATGFLVLGGVGMVTGAAFLANQAAGFPMGRPGTILSAGVIPAVNLVIGLKIASGLTAVFYSMTAHTEPAGSFALPGTREGQD
jgi:multicomponent Na+:H+ antiporter subunit B